MGKILNIYILKVFLIRFICVLMSITLLLFLGEGISWGVKLNLFRFANNISEILNFVFFITTVWTLVTFHKSRELIIFQTTSFSNLKILRIFINFAFIVSVFYLTIYQGMILKALSRHFSGEGSLSMFNVFNEEKECKYNLFLLSEVQNINNNIFFKKGELLEFNECKLINFFSVKEGKIGASLNGNGITVNGNFMLLDRISMETKKYEYPLEVLIKYFNENIDSKSYKTFYESIKLVFQFKKFNIQTRTMEIFILETFHKITSFFYMILIAFVFFSHFPPRGKLIWRFSIASTVVACVHITISIIFSLIKQSDFLSPYLMILPSLIVIIVALLATVFTEITFKNLIS